MSLSVASSYSWGVMRALVRAQHAVARELEVRRVQPAAGAVDAAVGGTLHNEGVLHPAALAPLIHAPAARHHLEQPGGGAPAAGVGAEARAAAAGHPPARAQDGALVAL